MRCRLRAVRAVGVAVICGLLLAASPAYAECDPDTALSEDDFEFLDPSWGTPDDNFTVADGVRVLKSFWGQVNFQTQQQQKVVRALQHLAIARDLTELRKGSTEAQTDLVVGLYKLAKVTNGERKEAVIGEGLEILGRLDTEGKLTKDQKGWSESFQSLRNAAPQQATGQ
jgi:hypothetical protein